MILWINIPLSEKIDEITRKVCCTSAKAEGRAREEECQQNVSVLTVTVQLSPQMYRETLLPGKGCGVLAERDISPGELIIAETPLILLPWWVRHSFFPGREKKIFLERCVRDFTPTQRKQFFDLHDSKVGENEEKTIDGIWRTNNFALGPSSPKCDNGLFLKISRFNHSCVPYAEFVWNEDRKLQEIRAIRTIPRGAEITISYFTKVLAVK